MIRNLVTAAKYLLLGVSLGLLLAPRSGVETRHLVRQRGTTWLQETLNLGQRTQMPPQA